jgi:hypothetical protein
MNPFLCARASRGPLRINALACAGLVAGAALLLAGCSQAGTAGTPSSGSFGPANAHAPAGANGGAAPAALPAAGGVSPATGSGPAQPAQLDLSGPSIVYTANLTVQARDVAAEAGRATSITERNGGYVSGEQASIHPSGHALPTVSLQLKIPAGVYPAVLAQLSSTLGTQLSLSQQAQDVTSQVADVSSRVASAQAAIAQLRALLARAGSVADLLSVQQEIDSQESSLEELEADQRTLASETDYATVSLRLVSPAPAKVTVHRTQGQRHGFLAGLATGWRGLRIVVSAVLTAVGAALPFAAVAALLAAVAYAARRRRVRRRSRPTPAG